MRPAKSNLWFETILPRFQVVQERDNPVDLPILVVDLIQRPGETHRIARRAGTPSGRVDRTVKVAKIDTPTTLREVTARTALKRCYHHESVTA